MAHNADIQETVPAMTKPADKPTTIELYDEPGHLIRRAQQIAVSKFHDVHGRHVTPIQYAILRTLHETPGIDQVTLAQLIALDTSTTADIAARLETKGWILREVMPRRQRRLSLTPAGEEVLLELKPGVDILYSGMMSSLEPAEQKEFMRLLRKFVHLHDRQSKPEGRKTRAVAKA
jgi:DNA-binding MarR family transcriptional regulator